MLFSSIPFLYYFLPVVVSIYFLVPQSCKNIVLLLSSLIFYGWGEPRYVLVMLGSICICYFCARAIAHFQESFWSKAFLFLQVLVSLGTLGYFKYANFFLDNFSKATGISVPTLQIALPIGISFYTFQILSYVIDVYRGEVRVQKNILTLATYIALFPQLIAGPIVRYCDIEKQLDTRGSSWPELSAGCQRFLIGLGKKVLLANSFGALCNDFSNSAGQSVLFYWLQAVAFTLQIYFDFSGYSDMAIGLGRIFGFSFPENFNYPYISESISEFWRRWHISLGSWFRDYVYIPMGGNRVSKVKWIRNVAVVWFLTGFWHGASWNFILWGILFAVLLLLEKYVLGSFLKKYRIMGHMYVLFFTVLGFTIFQAYSLKVVLEQLGAMFAFGSYPIVSIEFWYILRRYALLLALGCVGATPLPKYVMQWIDRSASQRTIGKGVVEVLKLAGLVLLLIIVTAYLVDGSFNPFLYFRF